MTSNAYIATDGETVMKVGKANDVNRREKQIAIPIKYTIACLDEVAAFRVESQLRDFVIEKGGIQHQKTIDWFKFDPQIYVMLCEFATGLDGLKVAQPEVPEMDLDTEIHMLVARYYKLLLDEFAVEKERLKHEIAEAQEQITQFRRENAEKQEQIYDLMEQVAYWKTMYRLQEKISEAEKKHGKLTRSQFIEILEGFSLDEARRNSEMATTDR